MAARYKEGPFLCIPASLASPHIIALNIKDFLVLSSRSRKSLFLHVLPSSPSTTLPTTHAYIPRLQRCKTRQPFGTQDHDERGSPPSASIIKSPTKRKLAFERDHDQPSTRKEDHPQSGSLPLRSAIRLTRKRSSSDASSEEVPGSKRTALALPLGRGGLGDSDSPSQICLCQPDPKVPRPRNGMYLDVASIYSIPKFHV